MNVVADALREGLRTDEQYHQDIEKDGVVILFIDELHTIMGSGSGIDSTLSAANQLQNQPWLFENLALQIGD